MAMNIRIGQFNPTVGDIRGNEQQILEQLSDAQKAGSDLFITTELVTCGYPAMDLLEKPAFLRAVEESNKRLIQATGSTALLFGTLTSSAPGSSRRLCNSAILAQDGVEITRVHKSLLPTYDVFDELRYFEPNSEFRPVTFKGIPFGITICEDIWNNHNEYNYHHYPINPVAELKKLGAKVIINISASPYSANKPESRRKMLYNHAKEFELPILYANQCGANTEIVFDGDSMAMNAYGEVVHRANLFEPDQLDVKVDDKGEVISEKGNPAVTIPGEEECDFKALKIGLADYLNKTGLGNKILLGLSGGIDSALTAAIAAETVGAENVTGITMPSEFSSSGSIEDSHKLADNLGINFYELPVKQVYENVLDVMQPLFEGTEFSVAEENIQSRIRGMYLMASSNKFGQVLLNTGNKSELAVGYCTLYGDMAGGLSLLGDVYKTQVYRLCSWFNEVYYGREVIPEAIIEKPPSAELRPDQKDSDSLPEYDVLDAILIEYLEKFNSAEEIIEQGFPAETVKKIIKLVDYSEYKRKQAPPVIRISPKAFGAGRRIPIVQGWTSNQLGRVH